jgi:hypothetical protein
MYEVLAATWKKAYAEGEVELKFETKSDRYRYRFMLYNLSADTKRKALEGKPVDLALVEAVNDCTVQLEGDDTMFIRNKSHTPLMLSVANQLGVSTAELKAKTEAEIEAEAQESLDRIMGTIGKKNNPYY